MNIFDTTQNIEFIDNYFQDFKIDLSNLIIICSLNDSSKLGYVMSDRIKLIQVSGYTEKEKVEICKRIIGKQTVQLEIKDIHISNDMIRYLIKKDDDVNKLNSCENSGVRGLESIIKHILERLKILYLSRNKQLNVSYNICDFDVPYNLNEKDTDILLESYGTIGKGRTDILEKINLSKLPNESKQSLRTMLSNSSIHDSDNNKVIEYIQRVLTLPFNKVIYNISPISELYTRFKILLDKNLYGMDNVKEELITSICCKINKNTIKYKAIALVGPPGTGKTTIARTIATVFNIPL